MKPETEFRAPNPVERMFNRLFGVLVGLGLGLPHNYLVQVRGRKSGRVYSNPVDVLDMGGHRFLVAPRGRTQWVRNAEAAGEVTLKRGRSRQGYRIRAVPDAEKNELLKASLDRFALTVARYFPLPPDSPAAAFSEVASRYPVFELLPLSP
jgi:deazaflavin-dependent oxidoreductase (nitroreductase family)